jgi:hypothetical protein
MALDIREKSHCKYSGPRKFTRGRKCPDCVPTHFLFLKGASVVELEQSFRRGRHDLPLVCSGLLDFGYRPTNPSHCFPSHYLILTSYGGYDDLTHC